MQSYCVQACRSLLPRFRLDSSALRILFKDPDRTVFLHLHFSNYGKFEARLQAEAREIAHLLTASTPNLSFT